MSNQSRTQDPRELEPKPPFPEQEQEPVGLESEMEPLPDYGEESYRGKTTPMGRPGQPAELAPVFVFLASQDSTYITGECIAVTGGKPLA